MARPWRFLWLLLSVPAALAAPPRVVFDRLVPAAYGLNGAEEVAVVQATGDAEQIELFVEDFLAELTQYGTLRGFDARDSRQRAAANLSVSSFACSATTRSAKGSSRDARGERVQKQLEWVDATCTGRIAILTGDMKPLSSFSVRGEGTSSRVDQVTDDERRVAVHQAARYAAVNAAEQITPRRVREAIPLDENAPGFAEALPLVESNRLEEARRSWERVLRRDPRSAPLHLNLAAVCEALGDRTSAEQHYNAAKAIAPGEARYSSAMKQFKARSH